MKYFQSLRKLKYVIIIIAVIALALVEIGYLVFLDHPPLLVGIDIIAGVVMIVGLAEIAFYFGERLEQQLRHEIQERKEMEAKLRLRSTALESAANAIVITDKNGRFQYVNPAFTTLTGYTAAEALGNTHALLRSGLHDDDFYKNLWQTILSGQVWRGEIINKRKDGSLYTEEQIITPVLDEKNQPAYYIGIKHDITARKNAETKLRQYTERLRLIHHIDQAILSRQEPEGIANAALKYARELIPYDRASVSVFDPERQEAQVLAVIQDGKTAVPAYSTYAINQTDIARLLSSLKNDKPIISKFTQPKSEGGKILKQEGFKAQIKVPLIVQNQVIGILNLATKKQAMFADFHAEIAREIATSLAIGLQQARLNQSERRQRQQAEALRATGEALNSTLDFDEILRLLLDQLTKVIPYDSANIILIKGNTAFIHQNRGYERYGKETVKKISNLSFTISGTPNLQTILRTREPLIIPNVQNYEGWQKDKGISQTRSWVGFPIIVNNVIVAIFALSKQSVNYYQDSHVDILRAFASQASLALENARLYQELSKHAAELEARVKARTEALAKANERLKELDRLKSKFISDVSHELRTPITNVSMYLHLLAHGDTNKYSQYMRVLEKETERLSRLIEDIFDESRHTSHLRQADYAVVDINKIAFRVITAFKNKARQKGLALSYDLSENLPAVWGESSQLNQAITNLVNNSINYTQDGTITIMTHQKHERVSVIVTDTGEGILPEDMPHLFDRFYRGRNASQSTIPGTGLGLGVVREIVELHGGTVTVQNNEHKGASFEILLPAHLPLEPASVPEMAQDVPQSTELRA